MTEIGSGKKDSLVYKWYKHSWIYIYAQEKNQSLPFLSPSTKNQFEEDQKFIT